MSRNNTTSSLNNNDSLTLYYKDVEETRLLTAQEERELIIKYHNTKCSKARDFIIKGALRYVIAEARKHPRCFNDRSILADLVAAGNIGLIRALEKFDPEAGTRFLTYAGWWVRHEMREEGRKLGLIHIPAHALAKGVRSPFTGELSDEMSDEAAIEETDQVHSHSSMLKLFNLATGLSVRESFIIKACFGVHTSPKTLKQIGKILDITGERVRQLRESALLKLRSAAFENDITF